MAEVIIRRARLEDLPRITTLWQEMMAYHLTFDPRFELAADSEEAYLEYLHSIMDNYDYAIFVAEREPTILGYTIGMILSNPTVFALARYGFIAEMAVTPEEQHGGIGQQMWNHARRWFHRRGITVIQLNVSPRNERGYRFWTKMGCGEFLHILWHNIPKDV